MDSKTPQRFDSTGANTAALSLPVAGHGPKTRRSKSGRRRALVLLGVNLLIAIHVAHWLRTGSTLTPMEPSEAMEFSKHGVINAGLIFFALAVVSTALLGRWICGWGCHLIALQDASRWLLGKLRIKPKPLRSRTLAAVPLAAFLYMFVAPLLYRALLGGPLEFHGVQLTTDEFWDTFPGWTGAILTFVVCGGVIIFLLGAKGFCTYGCPYGAVFGAADQLSPLRIRVTDACTHSGHCTAACSSNVRVHEEVRDFGMVVDPGCMKCLDCVSVCPNDALYFGLGAPALAAKPRATPPAGWARSVLGAIRSQLWSAVFLFAALSVFAGFDRSFAWQKQDWQVAAILTAIALLLLTLFQGKSTRRRDYGEIEELLLGVLFLGAMLAFRGLYDLVAFLFALGLSAIVAYLGVHAVSLWRRSNLSLHIWRLKHHGKLERGGYVFAAVMLAFAVFWGHSGLVRYHHFRAAQFAARISAVRDDPAWDLLHQARRHSAAVERWSLLPDRHNALRLAQLALLEGRSEEYERRMHDILLHWPRHQQARLELAAYFESRGRPAQAIEAYQAALEHDARLVVGYCRLGVLLTALSRFDEARDLYERGLAQRPNSAPILQNRGVLEAVRGDLPAAVDWFRRAIQADQRGAEHRVALGRALLELDRVEEGIAELNNALRIAPRNAEAHSYLGQAYARKPDFGRAAEHLRAVVKITPQRWEAHLALSQVLAAGGDRDGAQRHFDLAAELNPGLRGPSRP